MNFIGYKQILQRKKARAKDRNKGGGESYYNIEMPHWYMQ